MKKLILFVLLLLSVYASRAQNTHVKVSLRDGSIIEGEMKEFVPSDYILLNLSGVETRIPLSQVAHIDYDETHSQIENTVNTQVNNKGRAFVKDTLANYKGFLLAAGNNVYVSCVTVDLHYSSTNDNYVKYVNTSLRSWLKKDGFWRVVDNKNDAHFIINYVVFTHGSDKTLFSISSQRTGRTLLLKKSGGNESITDNYLKASNFYVKYIRSLQKKIKDGEVPKQIIEDFTLR